MKTANYISAKTLKMIESVLDKADANIQGGIADPDVAIAKAASECVFPGGETLGKSYIPHVAYAFNIRSVNDGVNQEVPLSKKVSSTPLADPDIILKKLYPDELPDFKAIRKKSSISDIYKTSYRSLKKFDEPQSVSTKNSSEEDLSDIEFTEPVKLTLESVNKKICQTLIKLSMALDHFGSIYRTADPALDYAGTIAYKFGDFGKSIVSYTEKDRPRKLASKVEEAPYRSDDLVFSALNTVRKYHDEYSSLNQIKEDLTPKAPKPLKKSSYEIQRDAIEAQLQPPPPPVEKKKVSFSDMYVALEKASADQLQKAAGEFRKASKGLGDLAGDVYQTYVGMKVEQDPDKEYAKFREQIETPEHLRKLREINSQATVTRLLQDLKDHGNYKLPEVAEAYNLVSTHFPRVADDEFAMRAIMPKLLAQGNRDDLYTISEIAKIQAMMAGKKPTDPTGVS